MLKKIIEALKVRLLWADWEDNFTFYGCLSVLVIIALLVLPDLWGGNV